MDTDVHAYSASDNMQRRDAKILLKKYIPMVKWNEENNVVMDIGCGPGNNTLRILLPAIPAADSIIAVDAVPSMIEFAMAKNSDPKISYCVADICDISTLEKWIGRITKVLSIHCLHWVQDQETAFKNIFNLLRRNGEAILIFGLRTPSWDSYVDLIDTPKWRQYLQNANPHVPESHSKGYGELYFREMLEEIGFSVLACEQDEKMFSYKNDDDGKESMASICGLVSHIPSHLSEDFKGDLFKALVKFNGRDASGKPQLLYTSLSLHLKKP